MRNTVKKWIALLLALCLLAGSLAALADDDAPVEAAEVDKTSASAEPSESKAESKPTAAEPKESKAEEKTNAGESGEDTYSVKKEKVTNADDKAGIDVKVTNYDNTVAVDGQEIAKSEWSDAKEIDISAEEINITEAERGGISITTIDRNVDVEVEGDVTATRNGVEVNYNGDDQSGVSVNVTVGGDVEGGRNGVFATRQDTAIEITGSVAGGNENGIFAIDGANVTVGGDVTTETETLYGVYVDKATVAVGGKVTSKNTSGVYALNSADVTVDGDIQGKSNGIIANAGSQVTANGSVTGESSSGISATGKGTKVIVEKDVTGEYTGVSASSGSNVIVSGSVAGGTYVGVSGSGSGTEVEVKGDVTGKAYGVSASSGGKVTIDGNVTSQTLYGVNATGSGTEVEVEGNVTGGKSGGVYAAGTSEVTVIGGVTSEVGPGAVVGGSAQVAVSDTITGGVKVNSGSASVTAWKVDGEIIGQEADVLKAAVSYIIKWADGITSAKAADDQKVTLEGEEQYTAHEDDEVTVTLDGYEDGDTLEFFYNKDDSTALAKADKAGDGVYSLAGNVLTLLMKKGGGMNLLAKITKGQKSEETEPEETKPEETKPEETKPEETKPEETTPEETKPEETKPEETKPEETKPEETKPEETEPEETKPEETKPEETEPEETEPEETEPEETEPEETEPEETEPEETPAETPADDADEEEEETHTAPKPVFVYVAIPESHGLASAGRPAAADAVAALGDSLSGEGATADLVDKKKLMNEGEIARFDVLPVAERMRVALALMGLGEPAGALSEAGQALVNDVNARVAGLTEAERRVRQAAIDAGFQPRLIIVDGAERVSVGLELKIVSGSMTTRERYTFFDDGGTWRLYQIERGVYRQP